VRDKRRSAGNTERKTAVGRGAMADGEFEIIDQLKNSLALSYCVCDMF
jgi:hypothetical protein